MRLLDFNPRAPCGARPGRNDSCCYWWHFNPRAPCGARLWHRLWRLSGSVFQSTRPVRGATGSQPAVCGQGGISIHAPHAGRDPACTVPRRRWRSISIHAPHAGRDRSGGLPPVGGLHFNPRAPCGARRGRLPWAGDLFYISIHAPHAGRDSFFRNLLSFNLRFQSTRPMRGATYTIGGQWRSIQISIHAPHAGRDCRTSHEFPQAEPYFNPRAPCGARRILNSMFDHPQGFQSTRPVRGATTIITEVEDLPLNFNPRAPCGARPAAGAAAIGPLTDFNPRAPCGARLPGRLGRGPEKGFQSTRPVRGATRPRKRALPCLKFQSTRPVRGATGIIPSKEVIAMTISIHAPRAGRDRSRIYGTV